MNDYRSLLHSVAENTGSTTDVDIVELLGPAAGQDYREVVINDRDPADVAQEHNRSREMVEKNVRRAKERKQELEDAGIET